MPTIIPNYTAQGIGDGTQAGSYMQKNAADHAQQESRNIVSMKQAAMQQASEMQRLRAANFDGYEKDANGQLVPKWKNHELEKGFIRDYDSAVDAYTNTNAQDKRIVNATGQKGWESPVYAANHAWQNEMPKEARSQIGLNASQAYSAYKSGVNPRTGQPLTEQEKQTYLIAIKDDAFLSPQALQANARKLLSNDPAVRATYDPFLDKVNSSLLEVGRKPEDYMGNMPENMRDSVYARTNTNTNTAFQPHKTMSLPAYQQQQQSSPPNAASYMYATPWRQPQPPSGWHPPMKP